MSNGSSSTQTPPSSWTLDTTSHLMQDYLSALDIPVVAPGPAPIASFINLQGGRDLVVISPDPTSGQPSLLHVFPDSSSCTGWNVGPVAESIVPSAVVAGNGNDGNVHVFAIGPAGELWHIGLTNEGVWASPDNLNCAVSSLSTTELFGEDASQAPLNFPLVVYGVTTGGDVLIVAENSSVLFDQTANWPVVNGWCCASIAPSPALSSTQIVMQAQLSNAFGTQPKVNIYTCSTTSDNLQSVQLTLPLTDNSPELMTVTPDAFSPDPEEYSEYVEGTFSPSSIAEAVTLSQENYSSGVYNHLLMLDQKGTLWLGVLVSGSSLLTYQMNAAPPPAIAQVCATTFTGVNGDTLLQVYLLDTSNSLWVARQSSWQTVPNLDDSSNIQPVWAWPCPVALGEQLLTIFSPPGADASVPLFGVDLTGALFWLQQDPVTGALTSQNILQPSTDTSATAPPPVDISIYSTTATLYDADGMPLYNTQVKVNASVAATLSINGTGYNVDATHAATVSTDATGSLSIVSPAMGLGTPQLIFNALGLTTPPVNPAQDIHDYLSGVTTDPNALPITLMTPFDSDGTALLGNGADGAPLVPNLAPADAATAAGNIISAFAALNSPPGTGQTSTADVAAAHAPSFHLVKPGIGIQDASILHKVEHAAGDIWHGIKNGAIEVADCTLKAEADGMHFLCTLGDNELDFVIHTIDDVVNVVHTIFASIKADLNRVVEWLRLVFSWDDINNTRKVLEHLLDQTAGYIQNLIQNHAEVTVQGFFPNMETDIRNACGFTTPPVTPNISTYLSTGTSISELAPASSPAPTALVASPGQVQGTSSQPDLSGFTKSPMARWVFDRARQYLNDLEGLDIPTTDTLSDAFGDFYPAVTAGISDFQAALQKLEDFFTSNIKNPADLKALNFSDLLAAMVDVIVAGLTFVDGFVGFLFTLLNLAMDSFKCYLAQAVNLPLISNVYRQQTGEQMTVLGLVALAHAFPLTVGYKAIEGATNPPFTPDQVSTIVGLSSTPAPAAAAATSLAQASTTDDPLNDPTLAAAILKLACGMQVINSVYTATIDGYGIATMGDADATPLPGWFLQLAILPEMLEQCLTAPTPSGLFLEPIDLHTPGDKLIAGLWGCYWAQPLLDFALCAVAQPAGGVPNTLLRYIDPVGKIASSGIGLITMGITIAACVTASLDDKKPDHTGPSEMNGDAIAGNILAAIPGLGQFLGLQSLNMNVEEGEPPNLFYSAQLVNDFAIGSFAAFYMWSATQKYT